MVLKVITDTNFEIFSIYLKWLSIYLLSSIQILLGDFCETSVNYCDSMPCEKGSTCNIVNQTWYCSCMSGFLGRRCNLLPCDWLPCHENSICINIMEKNATRNSYRFEY